MKTELGTFISDIKQLSKYLLDRKTVNLLEQAKFISDTIETGFDPKILLDSRTYYPNLFSAIGSKESSVKALDEANKSKAPVFLMLPDMKSDNVILNKDLKLKLIDIDDGLIKIELPGSYKLPDGENSVLGLTNMLIENSLKTQGPCIELGMTEEDYKGLW